MSYFSGGDQFLHGVQHFEKIFFFGLCIERGCVIPDLSEVVRATVGPVQLVEVDVIRLQSFQAAFHGQQDVFSIDVIFAIAHPR